MTHRKNWVRAARQLSILKRIVLLTDACQLNLNANTIHRYVLDALVRMLMNYKWMTFREASYNSVVKLSGRPASQTNPLISGWPSNRLDWLAELDGLVGLNPHWCRKMSGSCGWLRFRLECQGTELWAPPEPSRTLAECLHYVKQSDTHMSGVSDTVWASESYNSITHLKSCGQHTPDWFIDPVMNEHFWHLNLCKHFAHPAELSGEAPAVSAWWWWCECFSAERLYTFIAKPTTMLIFIYFFLICKYLVYI